MVATAAVQAGAKETDPIEGVYNSREFIPTMADFIQVRLRTQ